MDRLKIFSGRANLDLAKEITDKTGIELGIFLLVISRWRN